MIHDLLSLVVDGVCHSPACWSANDFDLYGYPLTHEVDNSSLTVTFDFWVEVPGTGWYQMCQDAGFYGYDGVNPAWAIELDTAE